VLGESAKKNNSSNSSKSEKTKWEEYQDALRDLKTNWLAKIGLLIFIFLKMS
jgi:hypothetical protein